MDITHLSLLYVEDDMLVQEETLGILDNLFKEITVCSDGRSARDRLAQQRFDVMIFDIRLPHVNGIELAVNAKAQDPDAQIIITSSYEEVADLKEFIRLGVVDYLSKPFSLDELMGALFKAASQSHKRSTLHYDRQMKTLLCNGKTVELTQNERLLLDYVTMNEKHIISYEEISIEVYGWKNHKNSLSAIRNLIYRLRKKSGSDLFEGIDGFGYRVKW